MKHNSKNSFGAKSTIKAGGVSYEYYDLPKAYAALKQDLSRLPFSLKVLMENLLRYEDDVSVSHADIEAFGEWLANKT